jgi:hypothetical protein
LPLSAKNEDKEIKIMKLITAILLFVSIIANSQDVIDFKLLYDKKVPSTANYAVADNAIDFRNIDHKGNYSVKLIGEYPKRLTLKNLIGGAFIFEGSVTSATNNKTIQIADCKNVVIDVVKATVTGSGSPTTGECGQLIYVYGKWQNVILKGGRLQQNGKYGGAAFQVESYSDPAFSHGTLIIDGLIVTSAMGEGTYIGYNQPTKAYLDTLIIRNTNISNTRRDFWQQANVRWTLIEDNVGINGGLEMNPDHVSGFSLNGKNNIVILRRNKVSKIPQFVYSATASNIQLDSNTYIQGDHAGPRANQAIYTKSPMTLRGNNIQTPKALIAAISADNTKVTLIATSNTIVAPKLERYVGTVSYYTPPPTVIKSTGEIIVETSTAWDGAITVKYFTSEGRELIIKP